MNDFEVVKLERDKRLRRTMLTALKLALPTSPNKGLSGRALRDAVDCSTESGDRTESDEHALCLMREMTSKGYFEERDLRTRKRQIESLDFLFYVITAKGIDLWNEAIGPDPLVYDDRI